MTASFEEKIDAVLRANFSDFDRLQDCRQLTAGASQETWQIVYQTAAGERKIALRRAQPETNSGDTDAAISLATEARLFELAGAAGIPGPQIYYLLTPEDSLGEGYFMEWLEGETLGHKIIRSDALADARTTLAENCGRILGKIHQLDWQSSGLEGELKYYSTEQLIEDTWQGYLSLDIPAPMIDFCWRWLKDNIPATERQCLVHGDFRNGNLMVQAHGINAVLDWELAHIGDPVRDLGWLCVNSWRFGNRDKAVGGFGDREQLLNGYRLETGIEIDSEHLHFWEVFGSFWWSITTLMMANSWRCGDTPSLERPVIGRRSSEAQMDCVNLLIPGDFNLPNANLALTEGTQLPMPAELLESVISFLKQDIAKELSGRNGFLAKVATNSLGIAQREFLFGEQLAAAEKRRLQSLLHCQSDTAIDADLDTLRRSLSDQLRQELPLDTPGLTDHLRQTVAGQLAIDQPHYSALHR